MKIQSLFTLLLLTSCASQSYSVHKFTPTLQLSYPTTEPSPILPLGNISKMPPTPVSPSLQSLIEKAMNDLAKKLSIPIALIDITDAREVTWPDSSLGCPQPGMVYADMLTTGYLVILNTKDHEYQYHAGNNAEIFFCENPTLPVPGMPGNT